MCFTIHCVKFSLNRVAWCSCQYTFCVTIHWERYSGMFRNSLSGNAVTKFWSKETNSLLPDVWLVVTVWRCGDSTGTELAMKGSWGHPGIAISEVKKQETGEEVKVSWSKTPHLDKFCIVQHEVYWQKHTPTKLSQQFWAAQLFYSRCLSHTAAAPFIQHLQPRNWILVYNQAVKIWKFAVGFFSFYKIQQECVKILGIFSMIIFHEYHGKLWYITNVEIKNGKQLDIPLIYNFCLVCSPK